MPTRPELRLKTLVRNGVRRRLAEMYRGGMRSGPGVPSATNKVHFACFACCKTFKQQGSPSWNSNVLERSFPCPDCKRPMACMGWHFQRY